MEKNILELSFQLRKPYNKAELLVDVFNQIIEEGGRCEISIKNNILYLKLFRCRNTFFSTSMGASIINKLSKKDFLSISKFNFASTLNAPLKFFISDASEDEKHGQILSISLYEHKNGDIQTTIDNQFRLLDMAAGL